ncbi:hypothetical protein TVAG_092420 [Trichomonas vaginalis G3]|uniref:Glycosyltransferase 61 catalytic domain-containing protein n=1 Tax=Trichomonas vaginalis (strain ATCC PRA-98 / G3) TaxID=412133 RepID=A2F7B8_TRIV3|nr:glycosyltransferase family [Trichomonas vaginalis G3]EAX99186.1 hypothetical protein TVAG_092420 [Trichomonas vaginalis G3]KAI5487975.1 glycosyltransferase family [Trichomonas vaginalis G3]|eukprot:XP_001312116.1 hypothetical protein [Trichomonas vaginalis G3]
MRGQFAIFGYPNDFKLHSQMKIPYINDKPIALGEGTTNIVKQFHFNHSFSPKRSNMIYWLDIANDTFDYSISHPTGNHNWPPHFGEKGMLDFYGNFTATYTLYRDVYVNSFAEFTNETHRIFPNHYTGPEWIYKFYPGPQVASISHGVMFGHFFCAHSFGHFTHDYMFPFMMTPKEILDKATIIIPANIKYARDYMHSLGYDNQIFELDLDKWVFCYEVLIPTYPRPHNVHFGMGAQLLNLKLREAFHLEEIIPNRFVFINRFNTRLITNMYDLYSLTVMKYPDIPWEYLPDEDGNLEFYAKIYSTIKVLIIPNGSNAFKCIFMAKDTLVVLINNEMWDISNYGTLASIGIKIIVFYNKNYGRLSKKTVIDPLKFMQAMDAAYFYIKKGNFPKPIPGFSFIDYKFDFCDSCYKKPQDNAHSDKTQLS